MRAGTGPQLTCGSNRYTGRTSLRYGALEYWHAVVDWCGVVRRVLGAILDRATMHCNANRSQGSRPAQARNPAEIPRPVRERGNGACS